MSLANVLNKGVEAKKETPKVKKEVIYFSDYQMHSSKGKIKKDGIYFIPSCQEDIDELEAQVIRGFASKMEKGE